MQREEFRSLAGPWPVLGCGVGLRTQHYGVITSSRPKMDWFEAITENFMDSGGRPLAVLEEVRKNYPVALHGVSLSIGSADPLDERYLARLKALADRIDPAVVSDHLCWTGVEGKNLHDLLPLPFTEEAVRYIAARIRRVQDALGRQILIENVSSYVTYKHSAMPEWEFLTAVSREADCGILLDLNNIYVNSKNHGFDPAVYLANVPAVRVGQFHLAGHTDMGDYLFDTHSTTVVDAVWDLYRKALELYGPVSTLIEWDEDVPEFSVLAAEAGKARVIYSLFQPRDQRHNVIPSDRAVGEGVEESKVRSLDSLTLARDDSPSFLLRDQRQIKSRILPGERDDADLSAFLNPQAGVSPNERISVYAGGYVVRIHEALVETFPAVRHVLGAQMFHGLAHEYAAAYPSQEYNLGQAGRFMTDFIQNHALAEKFPFLPDLCRLEEKVSSSFHAFENTRFDASALAGLSEEDMNALRFSFQESFKLFSSVWPVVDIWRARLEPVSEMNIPLIDRPQKAVIYRSGFEVRCEVLPAAEYETLLALTRGSTLGEVCQTLADKNQDQDAPIADWFAGWSGRGFLSGVAVGSQTVRAPSHS